LHCPINPWFSLTFSPFYDTIQYNTIQYNTIPYIWIKGKQGENSSNSEFNKWITIAALAAAARGLKKKINQSINQSIN